MTVRAVTGASLAVLLAATPAAAMSVAEFLAKAEALRAKGMAAMFSSDLKLLSGEMRAAGPAWRAQAAAARPPVCPPAKASMTQADIMTWMNAVPAAERGRVSAQEAVIRGLNARYRCP